MSESQLVACAPCGILVAFLWHSCGILVTFLWHRDGPGTSIRADCQDWSGTYIRANNQLVKGPILGLVAKAGQGPVLGPRPSNTAPHRHSPAPSGRHLRHQRFPRMPCLSCLVCRCISSLNIFLQLFELMPITAHCSVHMPKHPKRGGGPILWMCHAELATPPDEGL